MCLKGSEITVSDSPLIKEDGVRRLKNASKKKYFISVLREWGREVCHGYRWRQWWNTASSQLDNGTTPSPTNTLDHLKNNIYLLPPLYPHRFHLETITALDHRFPKLLFFVSLHPKEWLLTIFTKLYSSQPVPIPFYILNFPPFKPCVIPHDFSLTIQFRPFQIFL
jgi:hypothetical protein